MLAGPPTLGITSQLDMIALLTGRLILKNPDHCVIDVNGVGYGVHTSLTTFASLPEAGAEIKINIHTHVREDQLILYGFASAEEKAIFQRLIAVSGVGPKTALSILSGMPASHLAEAIANEDRARLSSIPGVGKKTAERIIVELKDRLAKDFAVFTNATASERGMLYEDTVSALTNLGYPRPTAENTLKKIKWSEIMPIEEAIKAALKELCRV